MTDNFSLHCDNINLSHTISEKMQGKISNHHCHESYEILYVVRGAGKHIVEGSEYFVSDGAIMLIRPLVYHHVTLDGDISYERYVINFSDTALSASVKRALEKIIGKDSESGIYYPPSSVSDSLVSAFYRFETATDLSGDERKAYVNALLSEIIILLSVASGETIINAEDELGARVIGYLNRNINRNVGLDKLAKRFFVSKYYLCRAFKRYSGISVHGYITHKRITYAKQLIEAGDTASSAAYKVGFDDYSAFYRAYKKIEGKSPTAE